MTRAAALLIIVAMFGGVVTGFWVGLNVGLGEALVLALRCAAMAAR